MYIPVCYNNERYTIGVIVNHLVGMGLYFRPAELQKVLNKNVDSHFMLMLSFFDGIIKSNTQDQPGKSFPRSLTNLACNSRAKCLAGEAYTLLWFMASLLNQN